jgi:methionine-rich copper-binding protein CopC
LDTESEVRHEDPHVVVIDMVTAIRTGGPTSWGGDIVRPGRTERDPRGAPGRRGRVIGSLVTVTAALLILTSDVSGHAVPIAMAPGENAVLPDAPDEVVIRFSERVEGRASSLTVVDAYGRRVDRGDATVDPSDAWRYRVTLPRLAAGPYTVAWRVLSADDGHLTEGARVFAVRSALGGAPRSGLPAGGARG